MKETLSVCVTDKATKALKKIGGSSINIPHCVDTNFFRPTVVEKEPYALFVGRLVPEKGILNLLRIAKKMENTNIHIKFIGKGPLDTLVKKTPNSELIGYLEPRELLDYYSEASVLVLPSIPRKGWTELFGIVLIESLACQTPVIASDCVGPREIINDKIGFIVQPSDLREIKNTIIKFCSDTDLSNKMGRKGREYVINNFDIKKVARKWMFVLKKLIAN